MPINELEQSYKKLFNESNKVSREQEIEQENSIASSEHRLEIDRALIAKIVEELETNKTVGFNGDSNEI